MRVYKQDGLEPMNVTEKEDDAAHGVAVDLIVSLGGTAESHGDEPQTWLMMGAVAYLRHLDNFSETITRQVGVALEAIDPDNEYLESAECIATEAGFPHKNDGGEWTQYDQRHAEIVEAIQLGIARAKV